jgi:hypothetical protein
MKKLGIALLILIVLIAGGVYYVLTNLNSIVKASIEKYGSEATQASVNLDSVNLKLTEGQASLSGLRVGNPQGFSTPSALKLGQIAVKLDVKSVAGTGPIVVHEIAIDKPEVTYEVRGNTNNLETIQKNAADYANAVTGGGAPSGSASSGGSERKLIIEDLYIRDGQINVSHAALQGQSLSVPLPTIRLKNIGKSKGGATPAEVADKIVGAITASAAQVAAQALVAKLGSAGTMVGAGAESGASTAGKALKGIFGQ